MKPPTPAGRQDPPPRIRVRMYRQGLGDCFLVTAFTGDAPVHALIDCGTLGATTTGVKMEQVVKNVIDETGGHLHLLVATHEHRDHVSGFATQRRQFDDHVTVDQVWLAWTEDADDPLAREVEKYKGDVMNTLAAATRAFAGGGGPTGDGREVLADVGSGIRALLGFFGDVPAEGAPPGMALANGVNEAMDYVRKKGKAVRFLSPGTVVEEPWLPGVRVYVLGPPRSQEALRNMGGHGSPELYGVLGASLPFATSGKSYAAYRKRLGTDEADEFQQGLPFEPRFRVEQTNQRACGRRFSAYYDPEAAWRRIDLDWLNGSSELALQLDSLTNNTSLALAVELVDDGTVLLFAADAQVGNWLSWHDLTFRVGKQEVTAADLLARAVFYKVGHHASHNATVNEKGLELMTREDLVAAIPVDRAVALKKHPKWMMPADALYARLIEKTKGRVLRSDTGFPEPERRPASIPQKEWDRARETAPVVIEPLYIDFNLP